MRSHSPYNPARAIGRCEAVCKAWRDAVESEGLWRTLVAASFPEGLLLRGVASWKQLYATRMRLAPHARREFHGMDDLQLLLDVRVVSTIADMPCEGAMAVEETIALRTVLDGRDAGWSLNGRFTWDVELKLPRSFAEEADAHGWRGDGPAHDVGRQALHGQRNLTAALVGLELYSGLVAAWLNVKDGPARNTGGTPQLESARSRVLRCRKALRMTVLKTHSGTWKAGTSADMCFRSGVEKRWTRL